MVTHWNKLASLTIRNTDGFSDMIQTLIANGYGVWSNEIPESDYITLTIYEKEEE